MSCSLESNKYLRELPIVTVRVVQFVILKGDVSL